jgi:gluconolactonase
LWFVEIHGGNLCRLEMDGVRRWPTGGAPNGLTVGADDRIWICDSVRNAILRFDPAAESFETICDRVDGEPLFKPNDLAFDGHGNLLFTCPGDSRREPTGYVCCRTSDGNVRKVITGKFFPNGLLCTDGELYLAETYRQRIWVGSWDGQAWTASDVLAQTGGAPGPDGLAMDADGLLYAAVFGAGHVAGIDPGERKVVRTLDLPGKRPTNCAFAPASRDLIVTEAEKRLLLRVPGVAAGRPLFVDRKP